MKLSNITEKLNELYPLNLKQPYDNVGLLVGSKEKDIKKILLALDLTSEVMEEAIKLKVDLIITHHPLIFKPLYKIDLDSKYGLIIKNLIVNDIAYYAMHTNFDTVKMNDYLADLLGAKEKSILTPNETIGVKANVSPTKLDDFINLVMDKFNIESVDYNGSDNLIVKTIGICGGSGKSLIYDILGSDIDLFITGDVSYSAHIDSKKLGVNVLDVGHYIEVLYRDVVKDDLLKMDKSLDVLYSNAKLIPFKRYYRKN